MSTIHADAETDMCPHGLLGFSQEVNEILSTLVFTAQK